MFARVFMRQQIALVALSLFDDDDAGRAIDKRTQREERGFRDHHFSTASLFLCFHATQKEQICCFLTHHPGLLEEDAR